MIPMLPKFERLSSSPGAIRTFLELNSQIDVTSILQAVQVPTLVLHRKTDAVVPVTLGRSLAQDIQGASTSIIPRETTAFGPGKPTHCLVISKSLSRVIGIAPLWSLNVCLRQCCSPISLIPPEARQLWATSGGGGFWTITIT